ncbi:cell division protein FtsW [Candidatus Saccharibacteria bacterium]|nr:cell division protein FtsW [Candidatus Saccharibacteria bacterium]
MRPSSARKTSTYDGGTNQRRHKPDYMLVVASALLLVIGLIVVYSISPGLAAQRNLSENYYITKQLTAILLGSVVFVIVANIPLNKLKQLKRPLIIGAGAATLVALALPVTPEYPAHRWIRFAGLSLQSVELIKCALLVWLAAFLANRVRSGNIDNQIATFKPLLIVLGVLGVVVAVLQRDLGSAGVLVAMLIAMVYVAGMPIKRLIAIGGILVASFFLLTLPFAYRRDRVTTFLNPEQDCQASGYQACQALIAVGSGGMFGKGLAHSVQAYGYLPEAANDSIFAIYSEKFGFLGSALLITLFALFFTRLKNIMERAPDLFSRLLVTGVLAWLSTQTIINIGAMIGLLPLKGITLPFISYGGTSIIFVLAAVGLVFNISRYTTYGANTELETGPEAAKRPMTRAGYGAYTTRRP